MALHPDFPSSPHAILDPAIRWFPADEALRETTMDKLMPPLVPSLRREVKAFRDGGYVGASATSTALLNWWFVEPHLLEKADGSMFEFAYYFAQREALETIVYLHDVVGVRDKHDLMRFDTSGEVRAKLFDETWRRFVIKMATGSGKTKVMSLAIAWSFFHKLYEPDSDLARNFLVIAPNIIVLDRIYHDFKGLDIFFHDPVLPDDGYEGRNWRSDFQLTLHVQDEVRVTQPTGNIFLTNIHRVYSGEDIPPTPDDDNTMDYFLGPRPTGKTTDSKVDLGVIVRDIDELMIVNDEAHHIHDPGLAWFKSIQDIHNRMLQKDAALSLQVDVTATPKHNNGAIFVQTVSDYPLVEAIKQNVVKHPVLPDAESRAKLVEKTSAKYTEMYADHLNLGVIEWRKTYEEHEKRGKKAILFVMTDDTRNCDEVAEYLRSLGSDLAENDAVLVIHTKNNGEISEAASGKNEDELRRLRKLANEIDSWDSPCKVIVSVLMLKEGWDVRNVTTIVGLRAYSAKSNILPEQTLGRGLRKMYPGFGEEYVSVIGTDAFMEFVESIQQEGVVFEHRPMGGGTGGSTMLIEVDTDNEAKSIADLDIRVPVLSPRVSREYAGLAHVDLARVEFCPVMYHTYADEELREIVFKDITTNQITHTTILEGGEVTDWRNVIAYFVRAAMKELKLFSGYEQLYGLTKLFVQHRLFGQPVDLETPMTLRNLAEPAAAKTLRDVLLRAINSVTVHENADVMVKDWLAISATRPFSVKSQDYVLPTKSVFNRIIGDQGFELRFAAFLEKCSDVVSFAKNYFAVGFKLDYVNGSGNIASYYPDFFVKTSDNHIVIVETKGREELDLPNKLGRLKQWCDDVNAMHLEHVFSFVYVDEDNFQKYSYKSFDALLKSFSKGMPEKSL
jgi:type III restriction enzyme